MKKLSQWAILIAFAILVVLPLNTRTAHAADYTYNSFTYTLSNNNATITGYTGSSTTITIPSKVNGYTVTSIGDGAFYKNTRITSVTIPASVTSIGSTYRYSSTGAFAGCSSLKSVTIASGTEDAFVGVNAFYECKSLQSITIPGNYTIIYENAFYSCSSITSATYQKNNSSKEQIIKSSAFANCSKLSTVSLGTTLTTIEDSSFANTNLRTLTIPEGVTSIGDKAFIDNKALTSVSLPKTLTKLGTTYSYSSEGVFKDCTSLKTVTIKAGTEDAYIGVNSFAGCKSLSTITVPGNYVTIYRNAFYECSSLTSFTYQKNTSNHAIQQIHEEAFRYCSKLTSISLPATLSSISSYAFANDGIKTLTIPEGVVSVGEAAFLGNKALTSVSLPSTLAELGGTYYYSSTGTFEDCSSLTTVSIAKGTENAYLGVNTFKNCIKLKSITVPGNYETIYNDAFQGCTSLTSFTFQKGQYGYANQEIGDNAFLGCTSLTSISLPTTLHLIGTSSFKNCKIKTVTIPEGVTQIGESAFENNQALTSVSLPSTLTTLGGTYYYSSSGVFQDCKNLSSVTIKAGTTDAYIGVKSFSGCTKLKGITVPGNYQYIYGYAFSDCTSMNYFILNKGQYSYENQEIVSNAFYNCTSLRAVVLPSTVSKIDDESFTNCKLSSITMYGTTNSVPHKYASSHGMKFQSMGSSTTAIAASISSKPAKTSYNVYDNFSASGLKLNIVYSNGTTKSVTSGYTLSGYNMNKAGNQTVTVKYSGLSTSFTINVAARNLTKASFSKVSTKTYNGKSITPSVTVKWGSTTLKKNTDYTVSYKNNKNTGTASIIIKGKGNYSGTKTITFVIKPGKASIASLKSAKVKTAALTIKKSGGNVSGYKIMYSTNKNFKNAKTTKTTSLKKTLKSLSSGKKLYVKVCAYKTIGKSTYYGSYSNVVTVKVK